jgi:serine/threonine protein kinase
MLAGLFEPVYRRTFTDMVCAWQFGEVLGNTRRNGKTVYKAYDTNEGIEVAWNTVDMTKSSPEAKEKAVNELSLLRELSHRNIINFHGVWQDQEKGYLIFITERVTSGTLSQ